MEDLSLHILDLVQNSVTANADFISISIDENEARDILKIKIVDNGQGMDQDTIVRVIDPFYTTRTTRRVGLGIPLLKATADSCDGGLKIESELGKGTSISIWMRLSHIDRPPIGNLSDTIVTLILCNPEMDFYYRHKTDLGEFILDTKEIRKIIGQMPIDHIEIITWVQTHIASGLREIHGGAK